MADYITGSSGFIGRNIKKKWPGLTPISHGSIHRGMRFEPCDLFFFLSAYGNMAHQTDYKEMLAANVTNLVDVISGLKSVGCKKFIYVSSSSVMLPVLTPYAHTKIAGESIVKSSDIPYLIIRPYSVTGIGEQREHLIPSLIRSCVDGNPMDLALDPVHDYIDIDDVVGEILHLVASGDAGTFELGNGIPISNAHILWLVEEITGKRANVHPVKSMRSYDSNDWYQRNVRQSGYGKRKTLTSSILEMVAAYRDERLQVQK